MGKVASFIKKSNQPVPMEDDFLSETVYEINRHTKLDTDSIILSLEMKILMSPLDLKLKDDMSRLAFSVFIYNKNEQQSSVNYCCENCKVDESSLVIVTEGNFEWSSLSNLEVRIISLENHCTTENLTLELTDVIFEKSNCKIVEFPNKPFQLQVKVIPNKELLAKAAFDLRAKITNPKFSSSDVCLILKNSKAKSVKKTEEIRVLEGSFLQFQTFDLKFRELCETNLYNPIFIQIYDTTRREVIGEIKTSIKTMMIKNCLIPVYHPVTNEEVGDIQPEIYQDKHNPSVYECIFQEEPLTFSAHFCIDFTSSNGAYNLPSSFHYIDNNDSGLNKYQEALLNLTKVLKYKCDYESNFLGFGAIVSPKNEDSFKEIRYQGEDDVEKVCNLINIFDISKVQTQVSSNLFDLLNTHYKESLPSLVFYGPTDVLPSLTYITERCKHKSNSFDVIYVLLDNTPSKIKILKEFLLNKAQEPILFVFIGIGDCGFKDLIELNLDQSYGNFVFIKHSSVKETTFQNLIRDVIFRQASMFVECKVNR